MKDQVKDTATEYVEKKEAYEELDEEIQAFRRERLGADSKDTEEKAKQLFSDVGQSEQNSGTTEEIENLREQKERAEEELKEVRENLWELLVNVAFPLNEQIESKNESVSFPYTESIDQKVLDGIADSLGEDFSNGKVTIGTEAIEVQTASVDEAIEAVQTKVHKIRDSAEGLLDVDSHVQSVHDRDPKVAAMLYVLRHADEPSMTKKQMEEKIGLDSGDLRGQLYHVLKNDPYLEKSGQQVSLRSIGENVIDEFVNRHGIPTLLSEEEEEVTK